MVTVFHGHMAAGDIRNHFGNEERIILRAVLLAVNCIISGFLLKGVQAANTGSDDYAYAVFVYSAFGLDTGISNCLASCIEGILGIQVKLAQFLAVKVFGRIEVLDFAGKFGLELRCVKMGDGRGAADTGQRGTPSGVYVVT